MDDSVREAMAAAKRLEAHQPASRREIVSIYRDGMKSAEELRELLKPAWFVRHAARKPE